MRFHWGVPIACLAAVGCYGELTVEGPPLTFGGPFDIAEAESIWREIDGHESWPAFAGLDGFQEGNSPHGAFQTFHLNMTAQEDALDFAPGSVIIKRNFGAADPETLGAITVMKKIPNFNPDGFDWFFAKYLPDGTIDNNPAGISLAGAVGKGGEAGCIPCHTGAPGGDFVFMNADQPSEDE